MQLNLVPEAERALEANPAEADGMQRTLVRVPEAAERCEVLLREILSVMLEDENSIFDPDSSRGCASVIGILKKLREDMSWTLHLLEELVPWPGKLRVLFELVPSLRRLLADCVEVCWPRAHLGGSARERSSAKS